jgi:hypothetical protein
MKMKSQFVSMAAGAGLALGLAGGVNAAPITSDTYQLNGCPDSFTTDSTAKVYYGGSAQLTAASQCQYLSPSAENYVASLTNINFEGFFGTTTWMDNGQNQLESSGWTGNSGSWSILNADFVAFDYMMVFKDGNNTNLIAFLFNEKVKSGNWVTPFVNPPFNITAGQGTGAQGSSHVSIFKRTGSIPPDEIPEPGVLFLMGAGLLGLGMARRRKSA